MLALNLTSHLEEHASIIATRFHRAACYPLLLRGAETMKMLLVAQIPASNVASSETRTLE